MSNALTISDLTKTYDNGVQALRGISFNVAEGDFFALLGANGAGKSTTIGIITSLVNKTHGKVHVFNYDLDTAVMQAKACLGVVPQEFNFHSFEPVWQILLNQAGYYGIPKKQAQHNCEKYLQQLDLWSKRNSPARELSGGMKRRLMIARALIHEPRLLILDEPTAGVDIEIRRQMWRFLQELNEQGTTIILTTHYLEEAESLCRNVAIIDFGRIIENTSINLLLKQLNKETFIFNLANPHHFQPQLSNCHCILKDESTLEIEIDKSMTLNQVFAELSAQNIEITSLRNKTNRLEELFLGLINQEHNHD